MEMLATNRHSTDSAVIFLHISSLDNSIWVYEQRPRRRPSLAPTVLCAQPWRDRSSDAPTGHLASVICVTRLFQRSRPSVHSLSLSLSPPHPHPPTTASVPPVSFVSLVVFFSLASAAQAPLGTKISQIGKLMLQLRRGGLSCLRKESSSWSSYTKTNLSSQRREPLRSRLIHLSRL